MLRYAVRRLALAVPVLLGITAITFVLMWIIPGDATQAFVDPKVGTLDPEVARAARERWGLDAPFLVQYGKYLGNILRGDLGYSHVTNQSVRDAILEVLPATARLALTALVISTLFGMSIGVFTALRRGSYLDTAGMVVTLFGVSIPTFWLGLLLMWLLAVHWPLFPPTGYGHGEVSYLVLPAVTLGLSYAGGMARLTRSAMLDVLHVRQPWRLRPPKLNRHPKVKRRPRKSLQRRRQSRPSKQPRLRLSRNAWLPRNLSQRSSHRPRNRQLRSRQHRRSHNLSLHPLNSPRLLRRRPKSRRVRQWPRFKSSAGTTSARQSSISSRAARQSTAASSWDSRGCWPKPVAC